MTTLTTTISIAADRCSYTGDGGGVGEERWGDDQLVGEAKTVNDSPETKFNHAESETEDEEVKMNCIGGARGMDDSDIYSDCEQVDIDNEDDSESDESDAEEARTERARDGVVHFVSNRVRNAVPLVRPKATSPPDRTSLSPLVEVDASDESTESSVGARGVALSLGTGSVTSESSRDEDDDSNGEYVSERGKDLADALSLHDEMEDGYRGENEDVDPSEGDDEEFEDELSVLLETLDRVQDSSDHDDDGQSERQIGVTQDRDDLINIPKTKRVLSFNTLTALNAEVGVIRGTPKRSKCEWEGGVGIPLVSFSLGPPAMSDDLAGVSKESMLKLRFRRESPLVSSSDDEALDRQLEAELDEREVGDDQRCHDSNSPVPLLTPPESPVVFEMNGDKNVTICEWPSNLVVDCALTSAAVTDVQPLTPSALEEFEKSDSERYILQASALTPLLQGISVTDL